MAGRRFAWFPAASLCAFTLIALVGVALPFQVSKEKPPPPEPAKAPHNLPPKVELEDAAKRTALIDKMITDYDLTPYAVPPIPDNPPPHEGALVSVPVVVEPPDLVLVEILEALPGRPISGERLVKPDGTISLGFYGDVSVKGLTLPQVKVAIIKHLRKFLTDDTLGLEVMEEPEAGAPMPEPPAVPRVPGDANPFDLNDTPKPAEKTASTSSLKPSLSRSRSAVGSPRFAVRRVPVRTVAARGIGQNQPAGAHAPEKPARSKISKGAAGGSPFAIDAGGPDQRPGEKAPQIQPPAFPQANAEAEGSWHVVPPEASTVVYIDITAYNSMNYYVQGDVLITGRLPSTGNETVMDALQFSGGLMSTADPKQISLIRPQRGGKPARVYKVDLEAIQARGEVATNYQIFPGDRLLVGRNEVVTKTTEMDRLNAPIQTMTSMMLQEAYMLRALQLVSVDHRDELLKEYVDFWSKALSGSGGVKFDEQTMREAFIRRMKLTPAPATDNARSR